MDRRLPRPPRGRDRKPLRVTRVEYLHPLPDPLSYTLYGVSRSVVILFSCSRSHADSTKYPWQLHLKTSYPKTNGLSNKMAHFNRCASGLFEGCCKCKEQPFPILQLWAANPIVCNHFLLQGFFRFFPTSLARPAHG